VKVAGYCAVAVRGFALTRFVYWEIQISLPSQINHPCGGDRAGMRDDCASRGGLGSDAGDKFVESGLRMKEVLKIHRATHFIREVISRTP
jgi:hypothetical protein